MGAHFSSVEHNAWTQSRSPANAVQWMTDESLFLWNPSFIFEKFVKKSSFIYFSQSAWPAITGYHRAGGSNHSLFLLVLEAGKSKIRAPADFGSLFSSWFAEGCPLAVTLTWWREGEQGLPYLLTKARIPSWEVHPHDLSNPHSFPVAPLPNIITWEGGVVGFQHMNFVETQTFSKIKHFELRFPFEKRQCWF